MPNQLLDAISREGVLASVSIRYWRAAKKLEAGDLGLNDRQIADRLIVLGHKRLLPREAMARFALVESRAHACVDRNSFPFLGGIARFVPNRNLAKLNETLEGLKAEFAFEIDSFMSRYRTCARARWANGGRRRGPWTCPWGNSWKGSRRLSRAGCGCGSGSTSTRTSTR